MRQYGGMPSGHSPSGPFRSGGRPAVRLQLLVAVAIGVAGAGGAIDGARAAPQAPDDARSICAAIAEAWLSEDHAALAARVAPDGVEIAINSQSGARNHYSPSQAFYFFKSLFTSTEQETFHFARLREEGETGMLHAVAEWSYRRGGSGGVRAERLFFTLQRGETGWGLTGVHAVR